MVFQLLDYFDLIVLLALTGFQTIKCSERCLDPTQHNLGAVKSVAACAETCAKEPGCKAFVVGFGKSTLECYDYRSTSTSECLNLAKDTTWNTYSLCKPSTATGASFFAGPACKAYDCVEEVSCPAKTMPTKCEAFAVEKLSLNCPMEAGFCVTVNIPTFKKQSMCQFANYHLHSHQRLNYLQIALVQATGQDQNSGVKKINSLAGNKAAAKAACLEKCLKYANTNTNKSVTGCEIIGKQFNQGCYGQSVRGI